MPAPTLTRIQLNPTHRAVRADLADTEGLHKTLMRLLPDRDGIPDARRQGGLLFRLDDDGPDPVLLIQTAARPDLDGLPTGYGTFAQRSLDTMFAALTPGMAIRYRITAAPSGHRPLSPDPAADTAADRGAGPAGAGAATPDSAPDGQGKKKRHDKIVPLHGDQALVWWHRRATAAGLHLLTVTATPARFRQADPGKPSRFHALQRFDGVARITDAEQLTTALHTGIGRGKAYGAGLLSLAPA